MSTDVPSRPSHAAADEIAVLYPPRLAGFRLRHYRGPADHPGMVRANNAAREAAGIVERVTLEGMTNQYANLSRSDAGLDVVIAEVDDAIVGYGRIEWGDNTDGGRDYTSFCLLDPAVQRKGVGRAMLAWQEVRTREIAASHETDRPQYFTTFVYDRNPGADPLLRSFGYEVVRHGAEMVRPTLADIPSVPLPDGIEVRPASPADTRAVWEADAEIFRDHWGATDETQEAYAQFAGDPKRDPSLWVVGWDGDEIAGLVLSSLQAPTESGDVVGYVDSVGVRRAWRRRGLGRALVVRALALLASRGATSAALGVDLQNQNEAARLYESVGFHIESTTTDYRKPLVPDRR